MPNKELEKKVQEHEEQVESGKPKSKKATIKYILNISLVLIATGLAVFFAIKDDAREIWRYLSTALASVFTEMGEEGAGLSTIFTLLDNTLKFLDPLYGISVVPIKDAKAYMDTLTLVGGIVSNLGYAAIFFFAGSALFRKRDIK